MRALCCSITLLALAACAQLPGLQVTGDPSVFPGATWTYEDTVGGVVYDLAGILRKPAGTGPFPAVVINHGTGGNANGYSRSVANEMAGWGYVGIGTHLTHADGVPCGSPGDCIMSEYGASPGNIQRAMKCRDILIALGYIDSMCIMSFGHSRGAWLTTGLVAAHPQAFSAAGHTAGGLNDAPLSTAPSTTEAAAIICPYIMQHGDSDNVVPLGWDELLDSVLNANSVPHQFIVFPGYDHGMIAQDPTMFDNVHTWFDTHGCSLSTDLNFDPGITTRVVRTEIFDITGRLLLLQRGTPSWLPPTTATGMLVVRSHDSAGRVSIVRRMVVERD